MKATLENVTVLVLGVCLFVGCGADDDDSKASMKFGPKEGFKTPEDALDALAKSMVDGDSKVYRQIAAKDKDAIKGLDILAGGDKSAKASDDTLKALAPNQGFGVSARRFPAEIKGNKASIIQLFERELMPERIHFRKFIFRKEKNHWFLVDSEFGPASKLAAKYAWEKARPVRIAPSEFDPGQFIPSDAIAAAVFNVSQGMESDIGKSVLAMPTVQAEFEVIPVKPTGFDRIVYSLGVPTDEDENDCTTVIFKQAITKKDFLELEFAGMRYETARYQKATYYRESMEPNIDEAHLFDAEVNRRKAAVRKADEAEKRAAEKREAEGEAFAKKASETKKADKKEAGADESRTSPAVQILAEYPKDKLPNANGHEDQSDTGNWFYYSSHTADPTDPNSNLKKLNWYKPFGRYQSPRGKMGNTDPHIGYTLKPSPMATPPRFPVLRWSSRTAGRIRMEGKFAKFANGGNGVQTLIYVDGAEKYSKTLAGNDKAGQEFMFELDIVEGTNIDFVVDPRGSGTRDDTRLHVLLAREIPEPGAKPEAGPARKPAVEGDKPATPKSSPKAAPKAPEDKEAPKVKADEKKLGDADSKVENPLAHAVYFPNDYTIISGSERQIRDIIAKRTASGVDSALNRNLAKADFEKTVVLALNESDRNAELQQALKTQAKKLAGDDGADIADLIGNANSVLVTFDLNGPTLLRLDVATVDVETAAAIAGMVQQLVTMLKQVPTMLPAKIPAGPDEPEIDNPMLSILSQLIAGITLQQPGKQVVLEIKLPDDLVALFKDDRKFGATVAAILGMGAGGPGPIDKGPEIGEPIDPTKKKNGPQVKIGKRELPAEFPYLRDLAIRSHDCRVFFPGEPEFKEDVAKIAEGDVQVATFEGKSPNATYIVEIYTYPEAFVKKMGHDLLLDRTRDTLVNAPVGKQISSKKIVHHGNKALDFVYQNRNTTLDGTGHCRVVIEGTRVWLLEIDGKDVDPQEAAAFHNSLAPFDSPVAVRAALDKSDEHIPVEPKTGESDLPIVRKRPPAEADLKRIRDTINDAYKVSSAKSDKQLALLLSELQSAIDDSKDDDERFALLEIARETSIKMSDLSTTLQLLEETTNNYDVDVVATKSTTLAALAKARVGINERLPFSDELLDVAEDAIKADQFETAIELVTLAQAQARLARELMLGREIAGRLKDIEQAAADFAALGAQLAALEADPMNAAAATAVGKFRCFIQTRWTDGLKLLAVGDDAALKAIAELDLAEPKRADEQIALGDRWWSFAENQKGLAKTSIRQRAIDWYRLAQPSASGLSAKKIENRIAELAASSSKQRPRSKRPIDLLRMIDLRKHVVKGGWRYYRGTIVSSEESGSRVVIPYEPPEEYDLNLELERKTRGNQVAIGFMAHGQLNLVMFDYRSTTLSSFFTSPPMHYNQRVLTNNRRTKLQIAVRKNSITISVEGKIIFEWSGAPELATRMQSDWNVPEGTNFFVGSSSSTYQFHSIKLVPR